MFTWFKRAVVALENIGLVLVKHDSGTEKRLDVLIKQTARPSSPFVSHVKWTAITPYPSPKKKKKKAKTSRRP